jgi:hypothetical protein
MAAANSDDGSDWASDALGSREGGGAGGGAWRSRGGSEVGERLRQQARRGVHGVHALRRRGERGRASRRQQERQRGRVNEARALPITLGKGRGTGTRGSEGARDVHARGHVGISSNWWRTRKWPAWAALLGRLRAGLANEPKMKFAHLILLHIFR